MTDYPRKDAFISDEFTYDTWVYSLNALLVPIPLLRVLSAERVGKIVVKCRQGEANQVILTRVGEDDLAASTYTANSIRLLAGDSVEIIGDPANYTVQANTGTVNIDMVYYLTS